MKLSPHFRAEEFACRCCGELHDDGVPGDLVSILECVRARFDAPVHITSGYRCPRHNARVRGATRSQHLLGRAADIIVRGVSVYEVHSFLEPWHRGGLGLYPASFVHVDVRGERARWRG